MNLKVGKLWCSILWGPHGFHGWWFNIIAFGYGLGKGIWFYWDRIQGLQISTSGGDKR